MTQLTFGDHLPHLTSSHLRSLHVEQHTVAAVFSSDGNAELEIVLNLDLNSVDIAPGAVEVNRFIFAIFWNLPGDDHGNAKIDLIPRK
jgi:hypothetical protein